MIARSFKNTLSLCGLFILVLGGHSVQAEGTFTNADLFWYSEPVSIDSMLNDWKGPFHGGTSALTHNFAEFGFNAGAWQVSLLSRYDYEMEFSSDTAELYYRANNKLPLTVGRTYRIDLAARNTVSDGIKFSRPFYPFNNLQVNIGISYLKGRRLVDGALRGNAKAISANDYDFSFLVDYYYSQDKLFDRQVLSPDGDGYSVDLDLQWQVSEQLRTGLSFKDLLARIYWKDTPYTTATAVSDTKTYDTDGYVIYKPKISGIEGNRDFTQILPRRISAQLDYQYQHDVSLAAIADYTPVRTFYRLGIGALQTTSGDWRFLYYVNEGAINVGYTAHHWNMSVTTDRFQFDRARTFGFMFHYVWSY